MKIWKNSIFYQMLFFLILFILPSLILFTILKFDEMIFKYVTIFIFGCLVVLLSFFIFEVRLRSYYKNMILKINKLNKDYSLENKYNKRFMLIDTLINFEYFLNEELDRMANKLKNDRKKILELEKENFTKYRMKEYQLKSIVKELEKMNDRLKKKEEVLDGFLKIIEQIDNSDTSYDMFFEELLYYLEKILKINDVVIIRNIKDGFEVFSKLSKEFLLKPEIIDDLKRARKRIYYNKSLNVLTGYELIMNLSTKRNKHGFLLINNFSSEYLDYPIFMKILNTMSTELINIADNLYYIDNLKVEKIESKKNIDNLREELNEVQDSLEMQLLQMSDMYEEIVTLYEAGKSLGRIWKRESLEEVIMEMILEIVDVSFGMIYYFDEGKEHPEVSHISFVNKENEEKNEEIRNDLKIMVKKSNIFTDLKEKSGNIILNDLVKTDYYETLPENLKEGLTNLMTVPIYSGENITGGVIVFNKDDDFTAANISLITALTNQLGIAVQNIEFLNKEIERKKEEEQLKIASQIQSNLFPQVMPKLEKFEFYGMNLPAKAVGGDYYDFIEIGDDVVIGLIADVSGKGIPAALLVSMVRTIFRMIVEHSKEYSPVRILEHLNGNLVREDMEGRFVTAICFRADNKTNTIELANAGHDPILVFDSKTQEIKEFDLDGTVLGIMPDEEFGTMTYELNKDDIMLLYTDGVVEARNEHGEFFEFDRLKDVISKNSKYSADYIGRTLFRKVNKFLGSSHQNDDITIISIKGV